MQVMQIVKFFKRITEIERYASLKFLKQLKFEKGKDIYDDPKCLLMIIFLRNFSQTLHSFL